jgi:hypothetical protein
MQTARLSRPIAVAFLACAMALPTLSEADDEIQPGQWRTTEVVVEMVNPMLAPELIAKRKAGPIVVEYCVRSSSVLTLLGIGKDSSLCQGPVDIARGRIAVQRTCTTGLGKGTRKIEGTYSRTRMETARETNQESPQGALHSKTKVVSERIGECK